MKSALVTGAGNGIGQATALAMARHGARVAVADLDARAAAETADLINRTGAQAISLGVDVTDPAQVSAMVRAAVAAHGPLDCAFNNAGVAPHHVGAVSQRSAEWSEASFDRMIDVNLKSVWLCMKHELIHMLAASPAPCGRAIVNMASIAGLIGLARASAYVAAKHGVVGLTRTAALEYANDGIRINAVCPGFIATSLTDVIRGAGREPVLRRTPMQRFGAPEEVAELVVWLCSDRASYVSGAAYAVDGGWTAA